MGKKSKRPPKPKKEPKPEPDFASLPLHLQLKQLELENPDPDPDLPINPRTQPPHQQEVQRAAHSAGPLAPIVQEVPPSVSYWLAGGSDVH